MIKTFPDYLLFPAIIFILFCGIFSYSHLISVDLMEARNFITAREIIESDNWLVPTMNGELRIAKPPLPTWLTAIAMKLAGTDTNLVANRLPAGLAALLLLLFLYRFTRSYGGSPKTSVAVILVLSTSYMFMHMSRRGTWDVFCHAFMLGAIYTLYKATTGADKKQRYFIAAGIFMGLSFVSKGPVAFYALLLPFLLSEIISGDAKKYLQHWKMILVSVLISMSISVAWPAYLYLSFSEEFKAIALKEVAAWSDRHVKSLFWYLQFPVMSGVWMFFALPALWPPHSDKIIGERLPSRKIISWIIFTVVLLSLIPEKKDRYLLPLTIPLALLIGGYVSGLMDSVLRVGKSFVAKWIMTFYAFLSMVFLAVGIAAGVYYFFNYGFSIYLALIVSASIAMLVHFISMLRIGKTPDLVYVILAFALLTQASAPLTGKHMKPDNFMEILKLRNSARLSVCEFYTDNLDMKVIWALGKKMQTWDSALLKDLKDDHKIALLIKRGGDSVTSGIDSGQYLILPDEEFIFENWQLFLVSRLPVKARQGE
ncbi:MAG: glycosyltransferase family 39 protein [Candidatus Riflebacteria bacterium]|nr:glycosyltransferase family 39 protein [Candidatus Riflebacteria bacterium]